MFAKSTEEITKFSSEAGPRNTKKVEKVVSSFLFRGRNRVEISGVVGGRESRSEVMTFGDPVCEAYVEAYNKIGESHYWKITNKNYMIIMAAFAAGMREIALPEVNCRETAEEVSERNEIAARREVERVEERSNRAEKVKELAGKVRKEYPNWKKHENKSSWARAAANIKEKLRKEFPGIKFSVKSSSYSMGCSVDVSWVDGPTSKMVEKFTEPLRYGRFDGMTDSSSVDDSIEGDAYRSVLGGAKHISCHRDVSEHRSMEIATIICDERGIEFESLSDNLPEEHRVNGKWIVRDLVYPVSRNTDFRGGKVIGIEWRNASGETAVLVPNELDESEESESSSVSAEYSIEKHVHTKKKFEFFICVSRDRIERSDFEIELNRCKEAGGWYSRAWNGTPGGFAFEVEADALAFAGGSGSGGAEASGPLTVGNEKLADRLDGYAEKMEADVEIKRKPMTQNWTPKRGAQEAVRLIEADKIERAAKAMRVLSEMHRAGAVPSVVAGYKTKKAILEAMNSKVYGSGGCYSFRDTGEFYDMSVEAVALRELIAPKTAAEKEALLEKNRNEEIEEKMKEWRGCKDGDFFPTPKAVADEMRLDLCAEAGDRILEPEAGFGGLVEDMPEGVEIVCVEQKISLAEILSLKGFNVHQGDFMDLADTLGDFDKIIMNPPFSKRQDSKHIRMAFTLLREGGTLVALASAGTMQASDSSSRALQELVSENGWHETLPSGSFATSDSWNRTGVSVVKIVLEK